MGTYSYPNSYGVFTDVKEIGANIQREIDWAASGDVVVCGAGTYPTTGAQVAISKSLTLRGENPANKPIIVPTSDSGNSGDGRAWLLVNPGYAENFEDLQFDASGYLVNICIKTYSSGTIARCVFQDLG